LFVIQLSSIPGPMLYALTKWRLVWDDWTGQRTRVIHALQLKYGPIVYVGPNEVHFNFLSALDTIYGLGSGYERTLFYNIFEVFGKKTLFTFANRTVHRKRKVVFVGDY
jgi:hypothetical protein